MNSPLKVFLSYCHVDEDILEKFKSHLAPSLRDGLIKVWYDRDLIAGSELNKKIIGKLDEADIVIFLVSSDFLNSYYCFEVELMRALKRKVRSEVCVIPMIVRPCDWKSTQLKDYTAMPNDGEPVSLHKDTDSVLLECACSIKNTAKHLKTILVEDSALTDDKKTKKNCFDVSKAFSQYLEDTEIVFQHKNKESIFQSDIFIYPDLRTFNKSDDDSTELVVDSSRILANDEFETGVVLILGGEQSGKKTLAKRAFIDNYEKGFYPVFIESECLPTRIDVEKTVTKAISEQYDRVDFISYSSSSECCVLVLTGFNNIKLNAKYQKVLLDKFGETFSRILVFSDSELRYNDQSFAIFEGHQVYEILRLSYLKKDELITKWNSLGVIETIGEKELHALNDQSRQHVDSIVRRNIIPSKPIFILTVLQTLESTKPMDYKLTSYGHCYEHLIRQSLIKAKISNDDFGTHINYLMELAYFIYLKGGYRVTEIQLEEFRKEYSIKYVIDSHEKVYSSLLSSGILKLTNQQTHFGYKYIFYFYIAKYLAEYITFDNAKDVIASLCEKIHTEKHANILIFVTHHTKSQEVIEEILLHASVIFENHEPNTISIDDFKHVNDLLDNIPNLVIEQRDINGERKKQLAQRDDAEGQESDIDSEEKLVGVHDAEEEGFSNTTLAEINSSAKAIEIIGQILRNRHGDLTKVQLSDLVEASFSVGLRFLDYYLNLHASSEEEMIQLISDIINEDNRIPDEQVVKVARNFYVRICYEFTFAVIKKIAFSTGSSKLISIFDEVLSKNEDSAALQLINLAIKLEFTDEIPFRELEKVTAKFKSNFVAKRMMQQLVVQHLYLHHVDTADKQRLSNLIKIPMHKQRQLQLNKKLKDEEAANPHRSTPKTPQPH